jgi:hypothetical protein
MTRLPVVKADDIIDPGQGLDQVNAGKGKDTIIIRPGDVPGFQTEIIDCGEDNDTVLLYGFPRGIQLPGTGTNAPVTITDPISRGTYLLINCETIARR